jgi:flagellar biosynthesis/type III secretory pathway protein FliH
MSHDHNFKNLILDYPHQAIDFFAAVEAQAIRGLVTLEPSPEQRLKYVDFIDIYADLDDNERQRYTQLYPQEVTTMAGFAQRFTEKGREEGRQEGHEEGHEEGLQRGEARILTAQLRLRFGDLPADIHQRIEAADADTLLRWSERVLTAATLDEILAD